MSLDLSTIDLSSLFREPRMFDSRGTWSDAGFQVLNRASNGKIMVAQHPSAPGLLFKKYTRDVDEDDQSKNFARRVEGSRRLRTFLSDQRLRHVVVPRKTMAELPRRFSRHGTAHVLVAERFDLLDDEQTRRAYGRIDPETLRDLCVVVHRFRGMDSNGKNMPFCPDGRIAFVDTEHWDRGSSKSYLHHVGDYLSADRWKMAKKIFRQLGDDWDDFDDEEDTSDSSSSS